MFIRQTRQEMAKVSWPSRRETMISVGMVLVFSIVLGMYFLLIDYVLTKGVALIFRVGT
jgi:preprotein translocase subunit SecE